MRLPVLPGGRLALAPALDVGAVVVLALVGLALRLFDIGREPLWLDEAGRVAIAELPLAEIAHGVQVVELSPPLYHYLLHAWLALAGGSDESVRLLSAFLVIPAVPLAWSVGRAFGGRGTALLVAMLCAVSPFAVHFGQEAAMYALLLPLALLTLRAGVGVLHGSRASRPRWLAVYVAAGIAALYTHYYAAFLLASIGLVGAVHFGARRSAHGQVLWTGSHLLIGLLFLPWLSAFVAQARLAAAVDEWGGLEIGDAIARWATALLADGAAAWPGALAVALLCVGGAVGAWRLRHLPVLCALAGTVMLVPLALAIVASGSIHSFRERGFLAVAAGPWVLLAAAIIVGPRLGRLDVAVRAILAVALLGATITGLQYHFADRKEDWRRAAGLVAARADSAAPIFFIHFGSQIPFDRYFSGPQPRIGLPESFDWADGYTARYRVTQVDIDRLVVPALLGHSQAWVVLAHEGGRGSNLLLAELDRRGTRSVDRQLYGVRVVGYEL